MNELEEGVKVALDFGKIQSAAASPDGLLPVVLQHADTNAVLFVGYANEQALQETLASGRAVLWSTTRNELWHKGATSGDWLAVIDVRVNCEQNSLLYLVRPHSGGVCHTTNGDGLARGTCYYRRLSPTEDALGFLER